MSNNITFRSVTIDDSNVLADIHYHCWQATYIDHMPEFCALTPMAYFLKTWDYHFESNHTGLIVEKDGAAIGFMRAGPASTEKTNAMRENGHHMCEPGKTGELYQIYLTKEAQGHGLGHQLFQQAVIQLHDQGFEDMIIDVYAQNNHAISFYRKLGAPVVMHYDDVEHRDEQMFINPSVYCRMPSLQEQVEAYKIAG